MLFKQNRHVTNSVDRRTLPRFNTTRPCAATATAADFASDMPLVAPLSTPRREPVPWSRLLRIPAKPCECGKTANKTHNNKRSVCKLNAAASTGSSLSLCAFSDSTRTTGLGVNQQPASVAPHFSFRWRKLGYGAARDKRHRQGGLVVFSQQIKA